MWLYWIESVFEGNEEEPGSQSLCLKVGLKLLTGISKLNISALFAIASQQTEKWNDDIRVLVWGLCQS
jgi:hypothetical protein